MVSRDETTETCCMLYYDWRGTSRIYQKGKITEFALPTNNYTDEPDHITAGPDGALWFTEYGSHKIVRFLAPDKSF
ncbi:MAG: hypothetical protein J2P37_26000 [Ktedonobacteraceae bacterium]|nr:hypothetical protein [Ktedonobacteraceae bacterium]MBO0794975.1 hypothetical protein [Ktedonobacteraceae bacterium]